MSGCAFFDLVKQHHAVRAAAHGLGQLTALVVAKVARRRTQQPGGGVLLLILRHIKFEQRFAAEPADRQCPRQWFLPTPVALKQHSTDGPPRLPPGPAAAASPAPATPSPPPALALGLRAPSPLSLAPPPLPSPPRAVGPLAAASPRPGSFSPG